MILLAMMFLTSPSTVGPAGVLVFFTTSYLFFLGLAVMCCRLFFILRGKLNKAKKALNLDKKSLRYGAVPLVRKTGGLKDTVALYGEEEKATGFGFGDYDGQAFLHTVLQAYEVHQDRPEEWDEMVRRGMKKNYSWKSSAGKYQRMYDQLLN